MTDSTSTDFIDFGVCTYSSTYLHAALDLKLKDLGQMSPNLITSTFTLLILDNVISAEINPHSKLHLNCIGHISPVQPSYHVQS